MTKNNKNNNSLFLYTALIFIAAIIIIIFAYFAQKNVELSQPVPSASATDSAPVSEAPQGIAKTASQLSQDNLELLEENRDLNSRINELNEKNQIYEYLIEAYGCYRSDDYERAKEKLEKINYETLNDDSRILYDFISSNIQ